MLKIYTLFRRKFGASVEEYQSYWRTGHVSHIKALPEVRRYIQNHPFSLNDRWPPYDGLVELWVDDTEALKKMDKSEGFAHVIEDEKIFVDRSTIDLVLTDEHAVLEGDRPEKAVKQIVVIKRKPGMSPAEFQDYWLNKHAPLGAVPQAAIASHPDFIRRHFGLDDSQRIVCAISFGFADTQHPINSFRTTRAGIQQVVRWIAE